MNSLAECLNRDDVPTDVKELIKKEITEHEGVSQKIRKSEMRFRNIFEKANDGIILLDNLGRILDINEKALQVFGGSKDEAIGRHFTKIGVTSVKDISKLTSLFENVVRGKELFIDLHIKNRKGQEIDLECSGSLVKLDQKFPHVSVIVRDITKRKQIESLLQEAKERYKIMVENLHEGVLLEDAHGIISFVNPRMVEILGYTEEELIGRHSNIIVPKRELNKVERETAKRPLGISSTYESELLAKDGRIVPIISSTTPLFTDQGVFQGILSVLTDITKRKKVEQALKESEEKYRTILENIEDGYYETDLAGNFKFFNDALCGIFGYPEDKLLRMNYQQLMDDKTSKKVYQTFNTVFRTMEPTRAFDWEIIKKDKTRGFLETSISLINDSKGKPIGFRGIIRDITKRKQIEEEMQLAYFSINSTSDMVLWVDSEARILYVNDATCQLLGYSKDDLLTMKISDIDLNYPLETWDRKWQVLREEASMIVESTYKSKEGRVFPVEIKGNYLNYLGKEYNFAFARDITERKKAERTLRRERDRAQQYLDTAGVLIDALDTEGNITLINKKGCEVLGYNNETELLGKNWIDTFRSEEDREMVKELYKAVMTGEMDLVEEYEDSLITKNGEKRYISWHHSLIRDDMGTITGILSSGNDITNQLQANKALRESEQKFRVLAESALVGMAIIQDYQLKYINDAMITIVGHPREEVLKWTSKEFLETIHPKDLSIVQNQLQLKQTGMKEEVIPQYHFRLITATEEIRCVNNFSSTVIYEGKPANLVTLIDITEQKQREEENLRLLAELKKTNMELRDFVSIASHDLKAPLRGIRNLAEILVTDHADKIDEEGKNILNLLINRVTRMYGLIEGILAYSRIGRISEEFIEVNLNELLLEVIDLLAPPENIKIEFVSELPTIWAQKTCILQIFQNLLDNAIKFNDKPEGNIQINFEDKGEDWEFSVNDNGSGIEARYFEKIFQIFQTLPTRDEQENIGIGLTIVQRIIEMYGGTIWVDSTVGSGSTFSFTLPKSV